jgi:hypothetical protein
VIHASVYYTGVAVWVIILAVLLWLAGELLWGFACAVSYTRFIVEIGRRRGKHVAWHHLAWWLLSKTWQLAGHRNRGADENHTWHDTTTHARLGQWRGIGDYTIYVPKP